MGTTKTFFKLFLCFTLISSVFSVSAVSIELAQEGAAYVGQPFNITITINGGGRNTDLTEIAGLEQFTVLGKNRSTNITMVNGSVTYNATHFYTLQAQNEGTYTIGPAKVRDNGDVIESKSISVQIKKKTAQSTQQNNTGSTGIKCVLKTDKTDVVVGEPIVLTASIYLSGQILQLSMENPMFPGFSVKEIKKEARRHDLVDGTPYDIIEKSYVLFPLQDGQKIINPMTVTAEVPVQHRRKQHGFFAEDLFENFFGHNTEQKKISSNDVKINVSPVPKTKTVVQGIGDFTDFQATLDKQDVLTNEPILLTLTLSGKGNLDQVATPKLILPAGFKYYESKSLIEEDLATGYQGGKKRFEFVLQATKAGDWTIDSQSFVFYSPEAKSFKTIKTDEFALVVTQRPQESTQPVPPKHEPDPDDETNEQQTVDVQEKQTIVQDISFIHEDITTKKAHRALPWWLFLFLVLFFPIVLFQQNFWVTLGFFTKRLGSTQSRQKILDAYAKKLELITKKNDACALHQFFLQFLATKYDPEAVTITEDAIEQHLAQSGWERDKINEFMGYLSECARLHFSSQKTDVIAQNSLLKKAKYWLLMLNK